MIIDIKSIVLQSNINNTLTIERIVKSNETSEKFGIVLNFKDITKLLEIQTTSVINDGRIEFGTGVIDKFNVAFCDSPYVYIKDYIEVLESLIETFYYLKNHSFDIIPDDELINQMRITFDKSFGSIELT